MSHQTEKSAKKLSKKEAKVKKGGAGLRFCIPTKDAKCRVK